MTEASRQTGGGTLGLRGVHAYFARLRRSARLGAAAYVLAGCAFGILSVPVSLWGDAQVGVVTENPGGLVIDVLPGSWAWHEGIRPSQRVEALVSADAPTGWRIVTTADGVVFESNASHGDDQVRSTLIAGALAAGCALAGVLALTRRPRVVEGWVALSFGFGAFPLLAEGSRIGGDVATAVGVIGPALWVFRWYLRSTRAKALLALGAIATASFWIASREVAPPAFDGADVVATGVRYALLAVVASGLVVPAVTGSLRRLGGLRTIDVAAAASGVILLAAIELWATSLFPIALGVVLFGIALYPRWRAALGGMIDHLLIADLRERASLEATEEERARLAHDLHDVPLQELSGVIRRMELQPELRGETGPLRQIADELRALATALRPPVLEDLGLAPALETLATQDPAAAPVVRTAIDNQAGYRPVERASLEVEVAVFRAAQEAVRNAVIHSGASTVTVSGSVGSTDIAIEVDDDGTGLSDDAVAAAMRRGRLGLPSMRRRMASIGGSLEFARVEPHGLSVRIRWHA
jgi:signal transduction histidine kinase